MKKRFLEKHRQNRLFSLFAHYIFVDKETGVNYLYVETGNSGGVTPLLDKDGKPIISKENIE